MVPSINVGTAECSCEQATLTFTSLVVHSRAPVYVHLPIRSEHKNNARRIEYFAPRPFIGEAASLTYCVMAAECKVLEAIYSIRTISKEKLGIHASSTLGFCKSIMRGQKVVIFSMFASNARSTNVPHLAGQWVIPKSDTLVSSIKLGNLHLRSLATDGRSR